MIINFNVSNMKLTLKQPNDLVAHSQDYLKAKFYFITDDWNDKIKVAFFSLGEPSETNLPFAVAIDENGECTIPREKISFPGYTYVGVGGTNGTVDLPTNYVKFKLQEGVDFISEEGGMTTPGLLSQMFEISSETKVLYDNLSAMVGSAELATLTQAIADISDLEGSYSPRLLNLENDNASIKTQIDTINETDTSLQNQIDTINETIDTLNNTDTDIKSDIQDLNDNYNLLDSNLSEMCVNVKKFGAIGDWNGTSGTDNITAFNNAVASLPVSGGKIFIPDGDYWISQNWLIDKEDVEVELSPGATVRVNTATTYGGTIAFTGYGGSQGGTVISPTRRRAVIHGGTVLNEGPNSWDNAIAASRFEHFEAYNINVPKAPQRAFAPQYGVNHIHIHDNIIGVCGGEAISTGNSCNNIKVLNNYIESAGTQGISLTNGVYGVQNVEVKGNVIKHSGTDGIYSQFSNNATIEDNKIYDCGGRGIVSAGNGVINTKNNKIYNPKKEGIYLSATSDTTKIGLSDNYIENPSYTNPNVHDGIYLTGIGGIPTHLDTNVIRGTVHRHALNIASSSGIVATSKNNNFAKGMSDGTTYNGWLPVSINDIFGGVSYVSNTWVDATLQNGWSVLPGSAVSYTVDNNKFVHLRGRITGGTTSANTVLLTLPTGYRPAYNTIHPVTTATSTNGGVVTIIYLSVTSDGNVQIGFTPAQTGWISLDGIIFLAT